MNNDVLIRKCLQAVYKVLHEEFEEPHNRFDAMIRGDNPHGGANVELGTYSTFEAAACALISELDRQWPGQWELSSLNFKQFVSVADGKIWGVIVGYHKPKPKPQIVIS